MILLQLFFIIIYLHYKLLHCLSLSPSALHVLPTGLCQPWVELPSPEQILGALSGAGSFRPTFEFHQLLKNFAKLFRFQVNVFQEWVLLNSKNMKRKMTHSNGEYGKMLFSKVHIFWSLELKPFCH